jgi:hypothetical protein
MDDIRATHERQLIRVDEHIRRGRAHIARQERLIAELRRDRHDTKLAEEVLATLLVSQAMHERHRQLLLREMAQLPSDQEVIGERARPSLFRVLW